MEKPDFKVRIEQFEGPLDLLLYLIEEQELDIYEVSLAQVTEQYLQYIYQAQSINLDIASEFLIMAARLLQMKVRRLLPSLRENEREDEDLNNFEEDLFRQLAEYKRYKEVVTHLKEKYEEISQYSFREIDEDKIIKEYVNDNFWKTAVLMI
jgi:segregation and condensation protein A